MQYYQEKVKRDSPTKDRFPTFLWIPIISMILSMGLTGQEQIYKVTKYNVSHGMSDNSIYSMLQDYQGFLWLGTRDGLVRYDGYTFKAYQQDATDSTSIGNRDIISLFEDSRQNLWIGSNSTLSLYDRPNDRFQNFSILPDRRFTKNITSITEDESGRIWIVIPNQGIYQFLLNEEKFLPLDVAIPGFIAPWNAKKENKNSNGLWEMEVLFNSQKWGHALEYKFFIRHADGNRTFEGIVKGSDLPYGNRSLLLDSDKITLEAVPFGAGAKAAADRQTIHTRESRNPLSVRFLLDTTGTTPFLKAGESIDIGGSIYPLSWQQGLGSPSDLIHQGDSMYITMQGGGFNILNTETGDITNFRAEAFKSNGLATNSLGDALLDDDGLIWMASNFGLNLFEPQLNKFRSFTLDGPKQVDIGGSQTVQHITQNHNGELLMTTQQGWVYHFNPITLSFEDRLDLNSSRLGRIIVDRSGIVWVASYGDGLFKLDPGIQKFPLYTQDIRDKESSYGKYILALEEDNNGDFWIAGELGALYHVNRKSHVFTRLPYPTKTHAWQFFDRITDLLYDKEGILWAASPAGLITYDTRAKTYEVFLNDHFDEESISNNNNNFLFEDSQGDIWVIGYQLNKYDPKRSKFSRYREFENPELNSPHLTATRMVEDQSGNFWIGTNNFGLLRFDKNTHKLRSYIQDKFDTHRVEHPSLDHKNRLWYNRDNLGLFQFDIIKEKEVKHITKADGLLHNDIQGIEVDEHGNLWLSSHRGLSQYNPDTESFIHYFKEDGLQNNEFRPFANGKTSRNELMFGGQYGFNIFHPDSIRKSSYIPPVVITDLMISKSSVTLEHLGGLTENIVSANEIQLFHKQNDITFKFAALDFSLPTRNKYTYLLDNYDETWREPSNKNSAEYTNLDPGSYRFQVKGSNRDGVWNDTPTTLWVIISPPWWQTWWAYSTYTILFLTLIWLARLYELNRVHFKNQVKVEEAKLREREEVDRLKSNFFTNISHEFRTPLTLIIGPLKKLIQESENQETSNRLSIMQRNATRLLKLINQLLDISKLEAHELRLRVSEIDIISFMRGILMSFHSLAEQKGVKFEFESSEGEIPIYMDRDKAEKIFSNLLSNAFKFTPASGEVMVTVSLEKQNDKESVLVKVRDSGIGIPPEDIEYVFQRFHQVDNRLAREHEGSGIGLALTKELVDLHHGTISVTSEEGAGTEFQVFLPLGTTHLQDNEIVENSDEVETEDELQNLADDLIEPPNESTQEDQALVLVVEDNVDMRLYISDVLKSDYRVEEAFDGQIGVERARELLPDLIISDLMMPKKDGFQLCQELKMDETTCHIPVILLTAKAEREDRLEGLETGADDYLIKPFDSKELLIRIKNLIDQRQRLRDRFSESIQIEASEITVSSMDAKFLQKAIDLVEEHLEDDEFSVEIFSEKIGLSRRQFYQKIKSITGLTPTEFILNIRLKRAALLIAEKTGSISEIAYSVGFNNLSYFARAFKKQFGVTPSKYPPE